MAKPSYKKPSPDSVKSHQKYFLKDGTQVIGATTIISQNLGFNKQALIAWAKRETAAGNDCDAVRDRAALVGTTAHSMVEAYLKQLPEPSFDEVAPAVVRDARIPFETYKEWHNSRSIRLVASEIQLVSETYKYGGTIDLLAEYDGIPTLIDLKTSPNTYADHRIQLSAYNQLLIENGYDMKKKIILRLSTDGSKEEYEISPIQMAYGWQVFESLLKIHSLAKLC